MGAATVATGHRNGGCHPRRHCNSETVRRRCTAAGPRLFEENTTSRSDGSARWGAWRGDPRPRTGMRGRAAADCTTDSAISRALREADAAATVANGKGRFVRRRLQRGSGGGIRPHRGGHGG
ncbi:GMC family oxidoreductase [Sesbania bispinosa]|nr:GMC family oxidoreductase [Sesbania bispinosa]